MRHYRRISIVAGALALASSLAAPALAQLTASISVAPDPVIAGDILSVELTVTNLGSAPVANATAQIDLPPAYVASFNQAYASPGGTCTGSGNLNTTCDVNETVTWSLGVIPAGGRATVTIAPQVTAGSFTPPNGSVIVFAGRANGTSVAQATASESATVQSLPSFELGLDASADPVAPGTLLTFTATFGNLSGLTVTGGALSLVLPAGVSFVSATAGGIHSAGVVSWSLGVLPAGQGGTREVTVQVSGGAAEGAVLRPTATIGAPTFLDARANTVAVVQSGAVLELEIEAGPDPIRAGEIGLVELTVSNVGASPIDPIVELRLDENIASFLQSYVSQGGNCAASGNVNTNCDARELLRWDVPTLAPGERITVQFVPQILAGSFTPPNGTLVPLRAIAYEPLSGAVGESALVRQSLLVEGARQFEVAADESADPVEPGGQQLYTVTYSNVLGANVAGVSLTLELPAGELFLGASDGGTFSGGVVTWNLGTLAAGNGGTRQVLAQIGALGEGTLLRARAQIQDSASLPRTARARAVGGVQSGPSLLLEMTADPDPVRAAETLTVDLVATNVGSSTIDPVVDLRVDEHNLAFPDSLASRGGSCVASGNADTSCQPREIVHWDVPPLAPGERIALQVAPQIPAGSFTPGNGTILPLRAEAYAPSGGAIGPRRYASQSVLVHSSRVLELELDESQDPAEPGNDLTYTLVYSNPSGAALPGVVIELPVPAGASFVSASDAGSQAAGLITWSLGTLPVGQGGTREAVVHIDPLVPPGAILETRALIRDGSGLPSEARAEAATTIQSVSPLQLEIEANPDPVRPAETADLLLTVTNVGNATIDPVLELRIDENTAAILQNLLTHAGDCSGVGNLNTTCEARELARWDLPPLAPGERRTVAAAPQVPAGSFTPFEGTIIPWRAEVFEPLGGAVGASRSARHSVLVRAVEPFELTLDASPNPSPPDGDVSYVATFGNTGGSAALGTTLRLPIPPGFSFVSATGGGSVNGGAVTWNLGSIPSGRGGKRSATLRGDGTNPLGGIVRAVAEIQDSAASPNSARGVAVSALELSPPLALAISATPNPAQPANFLTTTLTLTNASGQAKTNLLLETRLPGSFLAGFAQAGGADCTISGNLNTNCDARERIRWSIPSLGAGGQTSFQISPQVTAGSFTPPNGTLLRFVGIADGSQAVATHSVRIGISEDKDGDGLTDWLDNCPSFANANQSDIGGVGASSGPDGIGDACQCGDVNGNGRVTTADATLITRSLLVPPTATLARPDLCNVGGTTACTTADAVIVTRALLVPPTATIGQVCAPGLP